MHTAIYVRVSLDPTGEGTGVARQETLCRTKINSLGWSDPVKVYSDNSISASGKAVRPAYNRMVADIEAGKVCGVVAYHLDRLTRTPLEIERIISLAEKYKIKLATVSGDIDLSTDTGRIMARVIGAFARGEVERKGQRQKDANKQKAMAGGRTPRRKVFGYNADGSLNTVEAEHIKAAYSSILAGASLRSIYRDWNARGITTSTGGEWTHNSFRVLMMRHRNAGLSIYQGEAVGTGDWTPIVDMETFETVQRILAQPQRLTHSGTRTKYLLSYLMKCSCGGKTISGLRRKLKVYRCVECSSSINQTIADEKVISWVSEYLASPTARNRLHTEDLDRIADLRKELDAVAKNVERLQASGVPFEMLLDQGKRLQDQRVSLEAELSVLLQASALTRLVVDLRKPVQRITGVHAYKYSDIMDIASEVRTRLLNLGLDQQRQVIAGLCSVTLLPAQFRGGRVDDFVIARRIDIAERN